MKACFQIAECSFAFAKILQKSEIAKRFATFFILSPIFLAKSKYSSYLCRKKLQKGGWLAKSHPENIGD